MSNKGAKRKTYNLISFASCKRLNLESDGMFNKEIKCRRISNKKFTENRVAGTCKENSDAKPVFLELNDYCLLKIFDHMKVMELSTVSRVCKRLKSIAELHFSLKYAEFDIAELLEDGYVSMKNVKSVLRCFGESIKSIDICRSLFTSRSQIFSEIVQHTFFSSIAKYCVTTLDTMKLHGFYLTQFEIILIEKMHSLKSLLFENCFFKRDDDLICLSAFEQLKELTIIKGSIFDNIYPALERLQLKQMRVYNRNKLYGLIKNHKQLNVLLLENCVGLSPRIFKVIAKHMKRIF